MARIRVKTSPKTMSQSAGWTARVSSSVGSRRELPQLGFGDRQRSGGRSPTTGLGVSRGGERCCGCGGRHGSSLRLRWSPRRSAANTSSRVASGPIRPFSSAGVPRAATRPWCMIAELVAQGVGLFHVVGGDQDGRAPLAAQLLQALPHGAARQRDRGRSSARRGTGRRAGAASPAPAPAAGSSPRSRCARAGRPRPASPMNSSAASIRARRSARGMRYSFADSTRFSRAVSAPSAETICGT